MKINKIKIILTTSLVLNAFLLTFIFYQALNGCAEITNGRIGVLKEDTEVGIFGSDKTIFTLPKGLIVREASATGAGWFEPYRFRIVVTSDNELFVDYTIEKNKLNNNNNEYYSSTVRPKQNK